MPPHAFNSLYFPSTALRLTVVCRFLERLAGADKEK